MLVGVPNTIGQVNLVRAWTYEALLEAIDEKRPFSRLFWLWTGSKRVMLRPISGGKK